MTYCIHITNKDIVGAICEMIFIISHQAFAREGDYKMHPVRVCAR